jgi:hypothetical protein
MAFVILFGLLGIAYVLLTAGSNVNTTASDRVLALAKAIATAEGFYVSGSRPARDHNPGDMTEDLIGRAVGRDGPFVVYSQDADGWQNLFAQINLWLSGDSDYADSDSTIADLSTFYTTTQQAAWALNVANALGVSTDTPIGEIEA